MKIVDFHPYETHLEKVYKQFPSDLLNISMCTILSIISVPYSVQKYKNLFHVSVMTFFAKIYLFFVNGLPKVIYTP